MFGIKPDYIKFPKEDDFSWKVIHKKEDWIACELWDNEQEGFGYLRVSDIQMIYADQEHRVIAQTHSGKTFLLARCKTDEKAMDWITEFLEKGEKEG